MTDVLTETEERTEPPRGERRVPPRRASLPARAAAVASVLLLVPSAALAGSVWWGIGRAGASAPAADTTTAGSPAPAGRWTFPESERFRYAVRLGRLKLGEGEIAARPDSSSRAEELRRVSLSVDVGMAFVKVRNRQVSLLAPDPLRTLRIRKDYDEPGGERQARWILDHDSGVARRREGRDVPSMPEAALDGVGLLYLLRTMELAPGDTVRLARHFQPEENPVRFRVVGRDRIRVPAGRFETLVVEPVIPALGVFNEDRDARVWLTDDDRRLIVRVQSSTKLGPLRMHLREYAPDVE